MSEVLIMNETLNKISSMQLETETVLKNITEITKIIFFEQDHKLTLFGSSIQGLRLFNGDIDIGIEFSGKPLSRCVTISKLEEIHRFVLAHSKLVLSTGWIAMQIHQKVLNESVRVPIITLNVSDLQFSPFDLATTSYISGLNYIQLDTKVDLCVIHSKNIHINLSTDLYIRLLCSHDPVLRDTLKILKIWAQKKKILGAASGMLSTLSWVITSISVLQGLGLVPTLLELLDNKYSSNNVFLNKHTEDIITKEISTMSPNKKNDLTKVELNNLSLNESILRPSINKTVTGNLFPPSTITKSTSIKSLKLQYFCFQPFSYLWRLFKICLSKYIMAFPSFLSSKIFKSNNKKIRLGVTNCPCFHYSKNYPFKILIKNTKKNENIAKSYRNYLLPKVETNNKPKVKSLESIKNITKNYVKNSSNISYKYRFKSFISIPYSFFPQVGYNITTSNMKRMFFNHILNMRNTDDYINDNINQHKKFSEIKKTNLESETFNNFVNDNISFASNTNPRSSYNNKPKLKNINILKYDKKKKYKRYSLHKIYNSNKNIVRSYHSFIHKRQFKYGNLKSILLYINKTSMFKRNIYKQNQKIFRLSENIEFLNKKNDQTKINYFNTKNVIFRIKKNKDYTSLSQKDYPFFSNKQYKEKTNIRFNITNLIRICQINPKILYRKERFDDSSPYFVFANDQSREYGYKYSNFNNDQNNIQYHFPNTTTTYNNCDRLQENVLYQEVKQENDLTLSQNSYNINCQNNTMNSECYNQYTKNNINNSYDSHINNVENKEYSDTKLNYIFGTTNTSNLSNFELACDLTKFDKTNNLDPSVSNNIQKNESNNSSRTSIIHHDYNNDTLYQNNTISRPNSKDSVSFEEYNRSNKLSNSYNSMHQPSELYNNYNKKVSLEFQKIDALNHSFKSNSIEQRDIIDEKDFSRNSNSTFYSNINQEKYISPFQYNHIKNMELKPSVGYLIGNRYSSTQIGQIPQLYNYNSLYQSNKQTNNSNHIPNMNMLNTNITCNAGGTFIPSISGNESNYSNNLVTPHYIFPNWPNTTTNSINTNTTQPIDFKAIQKILSSGCMATNLYHQAGNVIKTSKESNTSNKNTHENEINQKSIDKISDEPNNNQNIQKLLLNFPPNTDFRLPVNIKNQSNHRQLKKHKVSGINSFCTSLLNENNPCKGNDSQLNNDNNTRNEYYSNASSINTSKHDCKYNLQYSDNTENMIYQYKNQQIPSIAHESEQLHYENNTKSNKYDSNIDFNILDKVYKHNLHYNNQKRQSSKKIYNEKPLTQSEPNLAINYATNNSMKTNTSEFSSFTIDNYISKNDDPQNQSRYYDNKYLNNKSLLLNQDIVNSSTGSYMIPEILNKSYQLSSNGNSSFQVNISSKHENHDSSKKNNSASHYTNKYGTLRNKDTYSKGTDRSQYNTYDYTRNNYDQNSSRLYNKNNEYSSSNNDKISTYNESRKSRNLTNINSEKSKNRRFKNQTDIYDSRYKNNYRDTYYNDIRSVRSFKNNERITSDNNDRSTYKYNSISPKTSNNIHKTKDNLSNYFKINSNNNLDYTNSIRQSREYDISTYSNNDFLTSKYSKNQLLYNLHTDSNCHTTNIKEKTNILDKNRENKIYNHDPRKYDENLYNSSNESMIAIQNKYYHVDSVTPRNEIYSKEEEKNQLSKKESNYQKNSTSYTPYSKSKSESKNNIRFSSKNIKHSYKDEKSYYKNDYYDSNSSRSFSNKRSNNNESHSNIVNHSSKPIYINRPHSCRGIIVQKTTLYRDFFKNTHNMETEQKNSKNECLTYSKNIFSSTNEKPLKQNIAENINENISPKKNDTYRGKKTNENDKFIKDHLAITNNSILIKDDESIKSKKTYDLKNETSIKTNKKLLLNSNNTKETETSSLMQHQFVMDTITKLVDTFEYDKCNNTLENKENNINSTFPVNISQIDTLPFRSQYQIHVTPPENLNTYNKEQNGASTFQHQNNNQYKLNKSEDTKKVSDIKVNTINEISSNLQKTLITSQSNRLTEHINLNESKDGLQIDSNTTNTLIKESTIKRLQLTRDIYSTNKRNRKDPLYTLDKLIDKQTKTYSIKSTRTPSELNNLKLNTLDVKMNTVNSELDISNDRLTKPDIDLNSRFNRSTLQRSLNYKQYFNENDTNTEKKKLDSKSISTSVSLKRQENTNQLDDYNKNIINNASKMMSNSNICTKLDNNLKLKLIKSPASENDIKLNSSNKHLLYRDINNIKDKTKSLQQYSFTLWPWLGSSETGVKMQAALTAALPCWGRKLPIIDRSTKIKLSENAILTFLAQPMVELPTFQRDEKHIKKVQKYLSGVLSALPQVLRMGLFASVAFSVVDGYPLSAPEKPGLYVEDPGRVLSKRGSGNVAGAFNLNNASSLLKILRSVESRHSSDMISYLLTD